MGNYLTTPILEKEKTKGSCESLSWGAASMQGWRKGMEDAHVTIVDLGEDERGQKECAGLSLFGVFDGHGGREVALFCEKHVPQELCQHLVTHGLPEKEGREERLSFKDADPDEVGQALIRTFHGIDDMLREDEHLEEIREYKGAVENGSSADQASEKVLKMQTLLQASISEDMQRAEQQGALSRESAMQVMKKMAVLKKLEESSMSASSAAKDDSGQAPVSVDHVGCTAVCVALSETHIICANAGDSRAILCRKGRVVELSHDHKPNDPKERERIEAANGTITEIPLGSRTMHRVNGKLNLARTLGDLDYKKRSDLPPDEQIICGTPDIIVQERTPDDEFIVVACDGIWDVKSNDEVLRFVQKRLRRTEDIPQVIEELLDECICKDPKATHGLGGDNMTCIVVKLNPGAVVVDAKGDDSEKVTKKKGGPFSCLCSRA